MHKQTAMPTLILPPIVSKGHAIPPPPPHSQKLQHLELEKAMLYFTLYFNASLMLPRNFDFLKLLQDQMMVMSRSHQNVVEGGGVFFTQPFPTLQLTV